MKPSKEQPIYTRTREEDIRHLSRGEGKYYYFISSFGSPLGTTLQIARRRSADHLAIFAEPLKWEGPPITRLAPRDPLKRLAPEIVTHEGKDYLLSCQWRGNDPRGIYLAPLVWEK